MAQATHTFSASDAAAEILAIINGRPRTPTKDELTAIVAKVTAAPSASAADQDVGRWHEFRRLAGQITRVETGENGEAEIDRLFNAVDAFIEAEWQRPAQTLFDILMRAECALYHENGIMESMRDGLYDERAPAQLIDATITLLRRMYGLPDNGERKGDC